jgi:hypothetical protein
MQNLRLYKWFKGGLNVETGCELSLFNVTLGIAHGVLYAPSLRKVISDGACLKIFIAHSLKAAVFEACVNF